MINKLPSAKANAIKFLLLLPLIVILLVAFRQNSDPKNAQTIAAISNSVQETTIKPVMTNLNESTLRNEKEKPHYQQRLSKKKSVKKGPNKKVPVERIVTTQTSERDTLPKTKKPINDTAELPVTNGVDKQKIENTRKEIEQSKIAIHNDKAEIKASKRAIEENRIIEKKQKKTLELQKQQILVQRNQLEKHKRVVKQQALERHEQKKTALKKQEAQQAKQKEQKFKQEKRAAIEKKETKVKNSTN